MSDSSRLWRDTRLMTVGTALSRITGLVRISALTYALGVTGTKLADTYNLANTTPNIVYELFLGGILGAVFVPVLIAAREHRKGDESALVSVALLALALVSVATAIAAPLIMRIYTFRVTDPVARAAQLELATFLLRWFAPQIFFYGMSAIAEALLNVRGRFSPPKFAPVLNNLVVIATFVAYARVVSSQSLSLSFGAKTLLAAGTTAGVVLQAIVLIPFLRKENLKFCVSLRDPSVARVARLAMYVIGYVVVNQIGLWVVLALANGVTGGVTAWQVAFIFLQFPHGLFAVSLYSALFPELTRAAASQDWDTYRERLSTGIRSVAYLLVPAAVGYAILAQPITRLLLARGVATVSDAEFVASVLQVFAFSVVFFSVFQLFARGFYALPDTRTPTALNAVAVGLNIAIDFPLFFTWGVRGLAAGHAISYAFGVALLAIVLNRRVPGGLRIGLVAGPLARIAAAAGAMGLCVWALSVWVRGPDVVVVGACVGAGAILYLAFSQVAGVEERRILLGFVHRRTRGGST